MRRILSFWVVCIGFLAAGCSPHTRTADAEPDVAIRPVPSPRTQTPDNPADLERLAAKHPDDAKAQARYGSALVEAGEVRKGITLLREAVTLDPELTAAWHNLGLAAERQGWLDISAEAYGKVVQAKPDHSGEWIKLGYALIALGRYQEAERAFGQAARLEPASSKALVALASSYYAHFQYAEALDALKRAAALNPRSAAAYVNMASIHMERSELKAAEEAARQALSREAEAPRNRLLLGKILAQSPAKQREAKELLDTVLARQKDSGGQALSTTEEAEAHYLVGVLARNAGENARAVTLWRQAHSLDPSRPEILQALGRALARQGGSAAGEGRDLLTGYARLQKIRDQERELRQRVEANPTDGFSRLRYGKILMEQGNLPRATWELREAVRLRPNDSAAKLALVDALRKQGREAE